MKSALMSRHCCLLADGGSIYYEGRTDYPPGKRTPLYHGNTAISMIVFVVSTAQKKRCVDCQQYLLDRRLCSRRAVLHEPQCSGAQR